ncbi:MAG: DUF3656 domain-containing U32 family peptidase [Oscillospiraceae bacterium]
MKRRAEILAPAGDMEQLTAAVRAGADAVYLGTQGFNARQAAKNFGPGELREAVSYCHARGVAVHVTLNTLVKDDELKAVENEARIIAESGADAVLIQDLAAAKIVRECCPDIRMHASTQMAIHDIAGVLEAWKLGFSRAVLARELSLREIADICRQSPIEIEVFVHGALCMSVSGCCYLSSMLGGRSGNRGRCAQPCRLDFRSGSREYALSLKDMSHIDHIRELIDAGVASLKIEGRLKGPEYAAAAVYACRQAEEGLPYDEDMLRSVFSRSGFTDGYLTGKRSLAMFGRRTEEDLRASRKNTGASDITRNEYPGVPVRFSFSAEAGKPSRLSVSDGIHTIRKKGPVPDVNPSGVKPDAIRKAIESTGGTPFKAEETELSIADGIGIRAGSVKAMRREALEELLRERSAVQPHLFLGHEEEQLPEHSAPQKSRLRIRIPSLDKLPRDITDEISEVIVPYEEIIRAGSVPEELRDRIIAEMPALVFQDRVRAFDGDLDRLRKAGIAHVLCENIGPAAMCLDRGFRVHGGAGLNILNSEALEEYRKMGLEDATVSFELDMKRILRLRGTMPRGVIAYGYLPLMRFRTCPNQGENGCGKCPGWKTLTDRYNTGFRVACRERRYSTLYNSVPLAVRREETEGLDFSTLWFTVEPPDRIKKITVDYLDGMPYDDRHTGGLYHRVIE